MRSPQRVTIYRDEFGVPHVFGEDDESTIFGFGYVQAEDFFWQVEDAYILALGRYSEVHGPQGLNSDLLNRAFEIVPRSERDFAALDRTSQRLYAAFVAGINRYLETHPEVRPRLIAQFEPWHVLAYYRHVALELTFRFTGLSRRLSAAAESADLGGDGLERLGRQRRAHGERRARCCWPARTCRGLASRSSWRRTCTATGGVDGQAWNFIGAGFYGSPTLAMGHNDRLGWTLVTNKPDIADVWRVRVHATRRDPLAYEYDGDWRQAEEWTETIRVRKSQGVEERRVHVSQDAPRADRRARGRPARCWRRRSRGLFEAVPLRQSLRMFKARNLEEFRTALAPMQMLFMNLLYADCDGNIWFLYNGRVPRRNPRVRLVAAGRRRRPGDRVARRARARRAAAGAQPGGGVSAELQLDAVRW